MEMSLFTISWHGEKSQFDTEEALLVNYKSCIAFPLLTCQYQISIGILYKITRNYQNTGTTFKLESNVEGFI